jgi:hypothetical protein
MEGGDIGPIISIWTFQYVNLGKPKALLQGNFQNYQGPSTTCTIPLATRHARVNPTGVKHSMLPIIGFVLQDI